MKTILLLLCSVLTLYHLSWAGNFSSSSDGKVSCVTYTHEQACDSAWVWFSYPDTTNFYDSLKLMPAFSGDGKILIGCNLSLDSLGNHTVKIAYMLGGDDDIDGYVAGIWEQKPDSTFYQGAAAGVTDETIWSYATRNFDF